MKTSGKNHIRAVAILALTPLLLIGCRAGYEVEVRNLTDQPVTMRLSSTQPNRAPYYHRTARAGPGSRAVLATEVGMTERMMLEVDFAGNIGYPATLDLSTGKTIVNVRRTDHAGEGPAGGRGRLTLEEIPRP